MNHQEPMRLSVSDAAKLLNVTPEAIRQRVRRGTLEHDRTEDGRLYVYVTPSEDVGDGVGNNDVRLLRDYVQTLKRELDARNKELAEMRMLLAGALDRIPQLEAPQEPSEGHERATEDRGKVEPRRPWWQRWFS